MGVAGVALGKQLILPTRDSMNYRFLPCVYRAALLAVKGGPKEVAICLLDWDNRDPCVVVDALDSTTQRVLASTPVSDFRTAKYARFCITGRIRFRISKLLHENNVPPAGPPAFSGVFFGNYR